MDARAKQNQEEVDGIELYETVSQSNEGYEIPRIAVSVLDNTNAELNDHYDTIATAPYAGMNGHYETLRTAPNQDHETRISTERKHKVVLLVLIVLVISCVLISSVSLVIALTIKEKNGGWSAWGSWASCSASCNVGLQSRLRTCTNPRPSLFGRFCKGGNMQVEMCESSPCKETHDAFNVYHSSVTNNSGSHTVIFTKVLLNKGGAYNETTGIFTASFSGLYQFNGQICTAEGKDVECTLQIEGKSFASGEHRTPSDAKGDICTSFSTVASVLKDEKVWIKSRFLYLTYNDLNSFSGILIHKT